MQTLLGQLLVYLLSSGEVVAVVGVLINVTFLLFAEFNPPDAAIPDGSMTYLHSAMPSRSSSRPCSATVLKIRCVTKYEGVDESAVGVIGNVALYNMLQVARALPVPFAGIMNQRTI
uniref:Uncharacterized protein n=1 Tax=Peronospora matthiolae TaxID=2874970 RepID=A0AAV1TQ73_9STRA